MKYLILKVPSSTNYAGICRVRSKLFFWVVDLTFCRQWHIIDGGESTMTLGQHKYIHIHPTQSQSIIKEWTGIHSGEPVVLPLPSLCARLCRTLLPRSPVISSCWRLMESNRHACSNIDTKSSLRSLCSTFDTTVIKKVIWQQWKTLIYRHWVLTFQSTIRGHQHHA